MEVSIMAQLIIPILTLFLVICNAAATFVVVKNDIKHLAADQKEMKRDIKMLIIHLLDEKK